MDGIFGRGKRIVKNFAAQVPLGAKEGRDIRNVLRIGYAEILAAADLVCEAESALQRTAALHILEKIWSLHSKSQETIVYRALTSLRNDQSARDYALVGFGAHVTIDSLLDILIADTRVATDLWTANSNSLKNLLQKHFDHECDVLFKTLGRVLDQQRLDAIGREFCAAKHNDGLVATIN